MLMPQLAPRAVPGMTKASAGMVSAWILGWCPPPTGNGGGLLPAAGPCKVMEPEEGELWDLSGGATGCLAEIKAQHCVPANGELFCVWQVLCAGTNTHGGRCVSTTSLASALMDPNANLCSKYGVGWRGAWHAAR